MQKFIYALGENAKNKLEALGYSLIQETVSGQSHVYVFENEEDMNYVLSEFSPLEYFFSDTLFV